MNIRWRVELSQDEREELTALLKSGRHAVRKVKRAQILLAADDGVGDGEVAARVGAGGSTVYRTKRRFVEGNLELALVEAPRPGAQRKLSGKEEALLIATACSAPPAGRARWTLELLADVMVALTEHEGLSRETVRRRLAENALKPWRPGHVVRSQGRRRLCRRHGGRARPLWRAPRSHASGDLLRREPDPADRRSAGADSGRARPARALRLRVQAQRHRQSLHLPRRQSPLAQGQGHRATCRRRLLPNACASSATSISPKPKRSGSSWTTSRPTARPPSTTPCPHPRPGASSAAWSSTSPPSTPAGSTWWRSRFGVLRGQCLDRRISSRDILEAEIAAWERQRNDSAARIKWMFTTEKARHKLSRAYPKPHLPIEDQPKES